MPRWLRKSQTRGRFVDEPWMHTATTSVGRSESVPKAYESSVDDGEDEDSAKDSVLDAEAVERFKEAVLQSAASGSSNQIWDLKDIDEASIDAIQQMRMLANTLDGCGINVALHNLSTSLRVQFEGARLYRRFLMAPVEFDKIASADNGSQEKTLSLAESELDEFDAMVGGKGAVQAWRQDVPSVLAQLESSELQEAKSLFCWILANEERLYAGNWVAPYRDLVPRLLREGDADRIAAILASIEPESAARAMVGDYTRIPDTCLAGLMERMDAAQAAVILARMSQGIDRPVRVVPILAKMQKSLAQKTMAQMSERQLRVSLDAAFDRHDVLLCVRAMSADCIWSLIEDPAQAKSEQSATFCAAILVLADKDVCDSILKRMPDAMRLRLQAYRNSRGFGLESNEGLALGELQYEQSLAMDPLSAFVSGVGSRSVRTSSVGSEITILESLDSPMGRKNVRIDLLEIDPRSVTFATYMASEPRPDYAAFQKLFEPFADGTAPDEGTFRKAGMFRLAEAVDSQKAVAGINGGFFFDYGHYLYGRELGLDLSAAPGLCFGDPVGWFVVDGEEHGPPIFNRGALWVEQNGTVHVSRIRMHGAEIAGHGIAWSADNRVCGAGEIGFYTSIFGFETPKHPEHVDVVVVNASVVAINPKGQSTVPFTGFVLTLPKEHPALAALRVGSPAKTLHPASDKNVQTALASGPLLVRDGEIDVRFRAEEFGSQDSSVMSFFLPRLFESYEAARSFLGLRADGTLVLGTVSGRSFGSGLDDGSSGMTFGELALLAQDLGLVDAMGLDGGGSSSLVIQEGDESRILNIPTGGADVPRGAERFISTALLLKPRG